MSEHLTEITRIDHAPTLQDEDLALVFAAQHGDIAAFEVLVKRHERLMFRIANNLLHNREDAEDAVQEAFLKAFHKLSQFQARSKLSTWLARITVNQALSKLRKDPVFWRSVEDQPDESGALPQEIADWAPNPEMIYTASELRGILEKNLRRLSPRLRSVFLLRDLEELSLEETAEALGVSVSAVKARSFRARLQLREWLTCHFRTGKQPGAKSNPE